MTREEKKQQVIPGNRNPTFFFTKENVCSTMKINHGKGEDAYGGKTGKLLLYRSSTHEAALGISGRRSQM
jgi:hypothetical protein